MKDKVLTVKLLFSILTFSIPFILFFVTSSSNLMFDDAAEFALVIKLGSIAHPPGTPSYILFGIFWEYIFSLTGLTTIVSLNLFSSFCSATATLLLFLSFNRIGKALKTTLSNLDIYLISFLSALIFAVGNTTWLWSNTIEVYSFQILSFSIMLYGLIAFNFDKKKIYLIVAGIGIALGLSNHHLTMLFFLPFTIFFFPTNIFIPQQKIKGASKKVNKPAHNRNLFEVFRLKEFWLLVLISFVGVTVFYGWMFYKAQSEYTFMFGKPDTFSSLIYHIKGGIYSKYLTENSSSDIALRIPYFFKLTFNQFLLFFFFVLWGAWLIFRSGLYRLLSVITLYFIIIFIYQVNNFQTASTDAYLLPSFFLLTIFIFYCIINNYEKFNFKYIVPLILLGQVIYYYPLHDRKKYPVSDSMMKLLDISAPENSVVIIRTWSTLIQYYYFRIAENFRPDLIVLKGDIKSTYYRLLPIMYPEFYLTIKKEYDAYIDGIRESQPEQLKGTGVDLNSDKLRNLYRNLIIKIESEATRQNRTFLTDPRSNYVLVQQGAVPVRKEVSGCFNSNKEGDTVKSYEFLRMDLPMLKSPMLIHDPSAYEPMMDIGVALDMHMDYYSSIQDIDRYNMAMQTKNRFNDLYTKIKKKISFLKF